METFDLYNKHGQKLNKTMQRGTKNNPGEYHKVVHIWFKNSNNEYLVQQRNKLTDKVPFQWAPTAGSVITNESVITGAIRETKEEIGLDILESDLIHKGSLFIDHGSLDKGHSNYIIEVFLVHKDINISDLLLDNLEVKDVQYMSISEIIDRIKEKTFWNFLEYLPKYDYLAILEKSAIWKYYLLEMYTCQKEEKPLIDTSKT